MGFWMPVLKMFSGCGSFGVKRGRHSLAVCYVPPQSSSRVRSTEEELQALAEGVAKYGSLGTLVICGDFHVRWGEAEDEVAYRSVR